MATRLAKRETEGCILRSGKRANLTNKWSIRKLECPRKERRQVYSESSEVYSLRGGRKRCLAPDEKNSQFKPKRRRRRRQGKFTGSYDERGNSNDDVLDEREKEVKRSSINNCNGGKDNGMVSSLKDRHSMERISSTKKVCEDASIVGTENEPSKAMERSDQEHLDISDDQHTESRELLLKNDNFKKWTCPNCYKQFSTFGLQRHLKVCKFNNTDESEVSTCNYCSTVLHSSDACNKHLRNSHAKRNMALETDEIIEHRAALLLSGITNYNITDLDKGTSFQPMSEESNSGILSIDEVNSSIEVSPSLEKDGEKDSRGLSETGCDLSAAGQVVMSRGCQTELSSLDYANGKSPLPSVSSYEGHMAVREPCLTAPSEGSDVLRTRSVTRHASERTEKGQLPVAKRGKRIQNYVAGGIDCPMCDRVCDTMQQYKSHLRCHEEKKFECLECHQLFRRKASLAVHRRCHTDAKPYQCSICSATFRHDSTYSFHMRKHRNERDFKCPKCNMAFLSHTCVKKHMERKCYKGKFVCGKCGRDFTSKTELSSHTLDSHYGRKNRITNKTFACGTCARLFHSRDALHRHQACVHSLESPWVCTHCSGRFPDHKSTIEHAMECHKLSEKDAENCAKDKVKEEQEKKIKQAEYKKKKALLIQFGEFNEEAVARRLGLKLNELENKDVVITIVNNNNGIVLSSAHGLRPDHIDKFIDVLKPKVIRKVVPSNAPLVEKVMAKYPLLMPRPTLLPESSLYSQPLGSTTDAMTSDVIGSRVTMGEVDRVKIINAFNNSFSSRDGSELYTMVDNYTSKGTAVTCPAKLLSAVAATTTPLVRPTFMKDAPATTSAALSQVKVPIFQPEVLAPGAVSMDELAKPTESISSYREILLSNSQQMLTPKLQIASSTQSSTLSPTSALETIVSTVLAPTLAGHSLKTVMAVQSPSNSVMLKSSTAGFHPRLVSTVQPTIPPLSVPSVVEHGKATRKALTEKCMPLLPASYAVVTTAVSEPPKRTTLKTAQIMPAPGLGTTLTPKLSSESISQRSLTQILAKTLSPTSSTSSTLLTSAPTMLLDSVRVSTPNTMKSLVYVTESLHAAQEKPGALPQLHPPVQQTANVKQPSTSVASAPLVYSFASTSVSSSDLQMQSQPEDTSLTSGSERFALKLIISPNGECKVHPPVVTEEQLLAAVGAFNCLKNEAQLSAVNGGADRDNTKVKLRRKIEKNKLAKQNKLCYDRDLGNDSLDTNQEMMRESKETESRVVEQEAWKQKVRQKLEARARKRQTVEMIDRPDKEISERKVSAPVTVNPEVSYEDGKQAKISKVTPWFIKHGPSTSSKWRVRPKKGTTVAKNTIMKRRPTSTENHQKDVLDLLSKLPVLMPKQIAPFPRGVIQNMTPDVETGVRALNVSTPGNSDGACPGSNAITGNPVTVKDNVYNRNVEKQSTNEASLATNCMSGSNTITGNQGGICNQNVDKQSIDKSGTATNSNNATYNPVPSTGAVNVFADGPSVINTNPSINNPVLSTQSWKNVLNTLTDHVNTRLSLIKENGNAQHVATKGVLPNSGNEEIQKESISKVGTECQNSAIGTIDIQNSQPNNEGTIPIYKITADNGVSVGQRNAPPNTPVTQTRPNGEPITAETHLMNNEVNMQTLESSISLCDTIPYRPSTVSPGQELRKFNQNENGTNTVGSPGKFYDSTQTQLQPTGLKAMKRKLSQRMTATKLKADTNLPNPKLHVEKKKTNETVTIKHNKKYKKSKRMVGAGYKPLSQMRPLLPKPADMETEMSTYYPYGNWSKTLRPMAEHQAYPDIFVPRIVNVCSLSAVNTGGNLDADDKRVPGSREELNQSVENAIQDEIPPEEPDLRIGNSTMSAKMVKAQYVAVKEKRPRVTYEQFQGVQEGTSSHNPKILVQCEEVSKKMSREPFSDNQRSSLPENCPQNVLPLVHDTVFLGHNFETGQGMMPDVCFSDRGPQPSLLVCPDVKNGANSLPRSLSPSFHSPRYSLAAIARHVMLSHGDIDNESNLECERYAYNHQSESSVLPPPKGTLAGNEKSKDTYNSSVLHLPVNVKVECFSDEESTTTDAQRKCLVAMNRKSGFSFSDALAEYDPGTHYSVQTNNRTKHLQADLASDSELRCVKKEKVEQLKQTTIVETSEESPREVQNHIYTDVSFNTSENTLLMEKSQKVSTKKGNVEICVRKESTSKSHGVQSSYGAQSTVPSSNSLSLEEFTSKQYRPLLPKPSTFSQLIHTVYPTGKDVTASDLRIQQIVYNTSCGIQGSTYCLPSTVISTSEPQSTVAMHVVIDQPDKGEPPENGPVRGSEQVSQKYQEKRNTGQRYDDSENGRGYSPGITYSSLVNNISENASYHYSAERSLVLPKNMFLLPSQKDGSASKVPLHRMHRSSTSLSRETLSLTHDSVYTMASSVETSTTGSNLDVTQLRRKISPCHCYFQSGYNLCEDPRMAAYSQNKHDCDSGTYRHSREWVRGVGTQLISLPSYPKCRQGFDNHPNHGHGFSDNGPRSALPPSKPPSANSCRDEPNAPEVTGCHKGINSPFIYHKGLDYYRQHRSNVSPPDAEHLHRVAPLPDFQDQHILSPQQRCDQGLQKTSQRVSFDQEPDQYKVYSNGTTDPKGVCPNELGCNHTKAHSSAHQTHLNSQSQFGDGTVHSRPCHARDTNCQDHMARYDKAHQWSPPHITYHGNHYTPSDDQPSSLSNTGQFVCSPMSKSQGQKSFLPRVTTSCVGRPMGSSQQCSSNPPPFYDDGSDPLEIENRNSDNDKTLNQAFNSGTAEYHTSTMASKSDGKLQVVKKEAVDEDRLPCLSLRPIVLQMEAALKESGFDSGSETRDLGGTRESKWRLLSNVKHEPAK